MAIYTQERDTAKGYLNVSVVDKNGVSHRVGGIPLLEKSPVARALLKKQEELEEGEVLDLTFESSIRLLGDEQEELDI